MSEKWYSNVPISKPVLHTDEAASFNGFAWSPSQGIVVQRGNPGKEAVDALRRLREER